MSLFFWGVTLAQTIPSMHLRLCEESVASSELQWSECENITPLLSHSWDTHGVDVTERVVHQPCGQPLNREASQGSLDLCRDTTCISW